MIEIAGQIFGWVAALFNFISYQSKSQKTLLIFNILTSFSICISYLFLGAFSGMALNIVCMLRGLAYGFLSNTPKMKKLWRFIMPVAMGICGVFSWQGISSLLIIVALVLNTIYLASPNVQKIRYSIIFTSSLILIYNIIFSIWGGVFNELIAISSSIIGIIRFRNKSVEV